MLAIASVCCSLTNTLQGLGFHNPILEDPANGGSVRDAGWNMDYDDFTQHYWRVWLVGNIKQTARPAN